MCGRWRTALLVLSGWLAWTSPWIAGTPVEADQPSRQLQQLQDRIREEQRLIRVLKERRARLLAQHVEWEHRLEIRQQELAQADERRRQAELVRRVHLRRMALALAREVAAEKQAQRPRQDQGIELADPAAQAFICADKTGGQGGQILAWKNNDDLSGWTQACR